MPVSFDGTQRLIIAQPGTTTLDMGDVYSRWKDWVAQSDNSKYLMAFSAVGGDPTVSGQYITPYFFLNNGWRIRPQEANHVLTVTGIVLVLGGSGEPFVPTLGSYNVSIRSIVPIRTETVVGSGADPWLSVLESGYTAKDLMRLFASVLLAKTNGGGGLAINFRDMSDGKNRVVSTVDANGNRLTVSYDPS